MDMYGIGNSIRAALAVISQASRGTGRTTSMVDSLKDGDRAIFTNTREARRVQRLCLEQGKKVDCLACDPRDLYHLYAVSRGRNGRLVFDHMWVEHFYQNAFSKAHNDLERFTKELSGRDQDVVDEAIGETIDPFVNSQKVADVLRGWF